MLSSPYSSSIRIPMVRIGVGARLRAMIGSALRNVRRAVCGLRGHEMVQRFEPDRLALECINCGTQTPGWRLDVRPALRTRAGDQARVLRLTGAGAAAARGASGDPVGPRRRAA